MLNPEKKKFWVWKSVYFSNINIYSIEVINTLIETHCYHCWWCRSRTNIIFSELNYFEQSKSWYIKNFLLTPRTKILDFNLDLTILLMCKYTIFARWKVLCSYTMANKSIGRSVRKTDFDVKFWKIPINYIFHSLNPYGAHKLNFFFVSSS